MQQTHLLHLRVRAEQLGDLVRRRDDESVVSAWQSDAGVGEGAQRPTWSSATIGWKPFITNVALGDSAATSESPKRSKGVPWYVAVAATAAPGAVATAEDENARSDRDALHRKQASRRAKLLHPHDSQAQSLFIGGGLLCIDP